MQDKSASKRSSLRNFHSVLYLLNLSFLFQQLGLTTNALVSTYTTPHHVVFSSALHVFGNIATNFFPQKVHVAPACSLLLPKINKNHVSEILNRIDYMRVPSSLITCAVIDAIDNCSNVHSMRDMPLFADELTAC